MIKEVLASTDLSVWAEASLLMFAAVFIAVTVRTLMTDRSTTDRHANIVMAKEEEAGND
ncbi:MAG: hypothetical protein JKY37_25330 [Nannocystaceae bacterium]|nr:hypothetical protein [Nannocystaceae bacterium]